MKALCSIRRRRREKGGKENGNGKEKRKEKKEKDISLKIIEFTLNLLLVARYIGNAVHNDAKRLF